MRFRTKAVHVGQEKDEATGATIPPVHLTTTFTHDEVGKHKDYEYSRTGNPTRYALEKLIASLEKAAYGLAFASGMAASHAVFSLAQSGTHVVISRDVYGGTYRLAEKYLKQRGVDYSLVDTSDIRLLKEVLRKNTKLIFIESPTNPLLKIMDIKKIKEAAGDILLVVDNTFATPYFQRPLELGADIVVHSSTKYLGGHSDVIGGLAVTSNKAVYNQLKQTQNTVGAVPSPLDCYLTIRGIKTLPLRMQAHQDNALAIAKFLKGQDEVKEVYYPGLTGHPDKDIADKQMSGYSGIVSFRIAGGLKESKKFLENLKVFSLAESLGGVESLASLPLLMTHAAFPDSEKKELGITQDLIRLSAGIEDTEDLIDDISGSLKKI